MIANEVSIIVNLSDVSVCLLILITYFSCLRYRSEIGHGDQIMLLLKTFSTMVLDVAVT